MALVTRGRLSVQWVGEQAWDVIQQLADKGGWDPNTFSPNKSKQKVTATPKKARKTQRAVQKRKNDASNGEDEESGDGASQHDEEEVPVSTKVSSRGRKRKTEEVQDEPAERTGTRRSTRARK